jgi:uncharacterized protein YgiM (DUF1202 family)
MRKVIVLYLLLVFITAAGWASTPFADNDVQVSGLGAAETVLTGTVDACGSVLNVRSGPWGSIVGKLADGASVKIIGSSGDWFKISYNGKTCYVHKNYVNAKGHKASLQAPNQSSAATSKTGRVSTGGATLNVRTGAWGSIVGSLSDNATVNIVGESGDWYKISYKGATRYVHKNYVSTGSSPAKSSGSSGTTSQSSGSTYDASVIGKKAGNGTVAGALTWARDQINGTKNGVNGNNGQSSKSSTAWAGWCLGFVNTAYGRSKPLLSAYSAIKSYEKFKAAGKINTNKNPPAGAAMFTGTTPGNPYGHIFIATGKMNGPNDPIIITTTSNGIKEMPMSQMWKGPAYLGWGMP